MVAKNRFDGLTFEDFRRLAGDPSLSRHEKVGFPDSYREGQEELIFRDIVQKLGAVSQEGKTLLEIGPGCSALPSMLVAKADAHGHRLVFVDSEEMLAHIPDGANIIKKPGRFPCDGEFHDSFAEKFDAILAYSVVQYAFAEGNIFDFLDKCLLLLAPGGEILFGDIPNVSMRKRFFDSAAGIATHQEFTGNSEHPEVVFNRPEPGQMDDSVVLALLARARAQGFHAWVLPQAGGITMASRREDLLIRRP